MTSRSALLTATAVAVISGAAIAQQTTITIATVNNGQMIQMQRMTDDFNAKHPDISSSG